MSSSSPSTKPPSLAYRENEVAEASQAVAEDVNAVEMSTRAQEKQGGVQDQPTPAEIGTAIRSKLKFTDEDDARMLYFVQVKVIDIEKKYQWREYSLLVDGCSDVMAARCLLNPKVFR